MVKTGIKQEIVDKDYEPKASEELLLTDGHAAKEEPDLFLLDATEKQENPTKFRKKNGTGKLCDLCGLYRTDLRLLKLSSRHIRYDLIFMTAIMRNLTSEDEIAEFWRRGRCNICPKHFTETCETILEMLDVQHPLEIQRADLSLIDRAVQKMNSMHEVEQEMNESTFMKIAQDFTLKYCSEIEKRKLPRNAQKRKAEYDEALEGLNPHPANAESSSDEIPPEQLIKICQKVLPDLIGFKKPKKEKLIKLKLRRPDKKKPRKNSAQCLFCEKFFSIGTAIAGRIPTEKLFLLLAAVEKKTFSVSKANLEFTADRWNVICLEDLCAATKDILIMFGAKISSEIPQIPQDSVEKLWDKAQEIQEDSEFILIKSVEQFLQEAKNFVDLYENL